MRSCIAAFLALTSCIQPSLEPCGGLLCPHGTTCDPVLERCLSNGPGCGNGVIDAGDDCEGADLGGADCTMLGFDTGTLACNAQCRFDTSSCTGVCGDDVRSTDEACDGDDLNSTTCESLGYYDPGAVTCTGACTFDVTACTGKCGDGMINGPELCDGELPSLSCVDIGFDFGPNQCTPICGVALANCKQIGWEHFVTVPESLNEVAGRSSTEVYVGGNALYKFDGTTVTMVDSRPTAGLWVAPDGTAFSINGNRLLVISGTTINEITFAGNGTAVWGRSSTDVYVASAAGTVWHYTGTASLAPMLTGVSENLNGISGTSTSLFAVGNAGRIVRFDQSGWTTMTSNTIDALRDVWFDASGQGFAIGDNGTIVHHENGTWTATQVPGVSLGAISGGAANAVVAVGADQVGRGVVLHYDGAVWRQTIVDAPVALTGAWAIGNDAFAVSSDGTAIRSTGRAWALVPSRAAGEIVTGTFLDLAGNMFVLVQSAGMDSRVEGPWVTDFPGPGYYFGMWASAANNIVVVGPGPGGGFFAHYDGNMWNDVPVPGTSSPFTDAWGVGPNNIFVVGQNGVFYHYDGSALTQLPSAGAVTLLAVWAASATDVFAASDAGAIYRYNGSTWTPMTSGTTHRINDLWGTSASNVHAVGDNGTMLHFDGTAWTPSVFQGTTFDRLRSLSGTGPTDVFVAGNRALFHFDGAFWAPVRLLGARNYGAVHATRKSVVVADDQGAVELLQRAAF